MKTLYQHPTVVLFVNTKSVTFSFHNWVQNQWFFGAKAFDDHDLFLPLYNTIQHLKHHLPQVFSPTPITWEAILRYGYYAYYDDWTFLKRYAHTTVCRAAWYMARGHMFYQYQQ
jgi:hypothetical protein